MDLTPDQLLNDDVLYAVGRYLYASEYADEYEHLGGSFLPGSSIEDFVPEPPRQEIINIMREYEMKLADAWKKSPRELLEQLGLAPDDLRGKRPSTVDALYLVLMACRGHGISLKDGDYDDYIDEYEEQYGTLNDSPFYTELLEFWDLAVTRIPIDIQQGNIPNLRIPTKTT